MTPVPVTLGEMTESSNPQASQNDGTTFIDRVTGTWDAIELNLPEGEKSDNALFKVYSQTNCRLLTCLFSTPLMD